MKFAGEQDLPRSLVLSMMGDFAIRTPLISRVAICAGLTEYRYRLIKNPRNHRGEGHVGDSCRDLNGDRAVDCPLMTPRKFHGVTAHG